MFANPVVKGHKKTDIVGSVSVICMMTATVHDTVLYKYEVYGCKVRLLSQY